MTEDFRDPLDTVLSQPAPRLLRRWPIWAAGFLVSLVVLAAIVRIDVVVTAPGRLATAAPPVILRAQAAAVLVSLDVAPGDRVEAGAILARLDPTLPQADLAALETEAAALRARITRLIAEPGTQTPDLPPDELQVLADRRAAVAADRAARAAELAALDAMLAATTAEEPGLLRRVALAGEVESMRAELVARETGSTLAHVEAQMVRIAAEAAVQGLATRRAELLARRAAATAADARAEAQLNLTRAEALTEARLRLALVEEAIAKARVQTEAATLVAPGPAMVEDVAPGGPGSLMAGGEAVVTLIPLDQPLVAELAARSADLGRIAEGDPVTLKIDAWPWRRHGTATGVLSGIGRHSATAEGDVTARHALRVELTGWTGPDGTVPEHLLPGLTLQAEIATGTRSLLDLLIDPLLRGLQESFREP
jgi:HlyD family secretion protein